MRVFRCWRQDFRQWHSLGRIFERVKKGMARGRRAKGCGQDEGSQKGLRRLEDNYGVNKGWHPVMSGVDVR